MYTTDPRSVSPRPVQNTSASHPLLCPAAPDSNRQHAHVPPPPSLPVSHLCANKPPPPSHAMAPPLQTVKLGTAPGLLPPLLPLYMTGGALGIVASSLIGGGVGVMPGSVSRPLIGGRLGRCSDAVLVVRRRTVEVKSMHRDFSPDDSVLSTSSNSSDNIRQYIRQYQTISDNTRGTPAGSRQADDQSCAVARPVRRRQLR